MVMITAIVIYKLSENGNQHNNSQVLQADFILQFLKRVLMDRTSLWGVGIAANVGVCLSVPRISND